MTHESEGDGAQQVPPQAADNSPKEGLEASGADNSGADNPGTDDASSGKRRRVAKTLLFNSPDTHGHDIDFVIPQAVVDRAEAAALDEQQASGQAQVLADSAGAPAEEIDDELMREQRLYDERMATLAKQRSERRVAKTLLFNKADLTGAIQNAAAAAAATHPAAATTPAHPAAHTPVSAEPSKNNPVSPVAIGAATNSTAARKKTRRIAKTLQEGKEGQASPVAEQSDTPRHGITNELADAVVAASQPKTKTQYPRVRQQYIARTMLDHSVLWETVSKFEAKMEVKVAEQILTRSNEPVKPFIAIECKKMAFPCGFKWDDTETKERFRYCELCKTPVYNFTGLEQPEADELIFQRENKRNATLYKRADGKFMTVNCPVQVKRKRDSILMIIAAVAFAIGAIAFMILMPRPPKPVVQEPTVTDLRPTGPGPNQGTNTSGGTTTPLSGGTGGAASDGSFRMINGQRVNTGAPGATATFPAPQQTPVGTTDSDESGEFWQYSGDPAGMSDAPAPQITPQAQPQAQPQSQPVQSPGQPGQTPEQSTQPPVQQPGQ